MDMDMDMDLRRNKKIQTSLMKFHPMSNTLNLMDSI